jgi:hypothetical protein
LPLDDVLVLHQVRNPVRTIRSLMGIEMFEDRRQGLSPYQQVAARGLPGLFDLEGRLRRCVHFWTEWNRRCGELAELTWRVEDVHPELLEQILDSIGASASRDRITSALEEVSTTINTRRRDVSVTWATVLAEDRDGRLQDAARGYGYHVWPGQTSID